MLKIDKGIITRARAIIGPYGRLWLLGEKNGVFSARAELESHGGCDLTPGIKSVQIDACVRKLLKAGCTRFCFLKIEGRRVVPPGTRFEQRIYQNYGKPLDNYPDVPYFQVTGKQLLCAKRLKSGRYYRSVKFKVVHV